MTFKAWLVNNNISIQNLSELVKIPYCTLRRKVAKPESFTFEEFMRIKKVIKESYNREMTLDEINLIFLN